ncbi:MAG: toll/interleukin-1 receptor domain-containing protein [Candidatus Sulfotelmatobacter sp.]
MAKMKIFVSWSGPRSAAVAEALKEYLPMINNAFDPWLSSEDIPKGSRSTAEIADALATAKAGIICLTPNNLTAPWILFEAGGVSKTVDKPLACTVLIDLEPSDVRAPLGEFQHTTLREKQLLQLVKTLNKAAGESSRQDNEIEKAFKLCWPELGERLKNLPDDGPTKRPERSPQDMFGELLDTVRSTNAEETRLLKMTVEGLASIASRVGRLEAPSTNIWNATTLQALDDLPAFYKLSALAGGAGSATPPGASETLAEKLGLRASSQPDVVTPPPLIGRRGGGVRRQRVAAREPGPPSAVK